MNQEIIEMARQVSNTPLDATSTPELFGESQIVAFYKLVAAKEREGCKKVLGNLPILSSEVSVLERAIKAISTRGSA